MANTGPAAVRPAAVLRGAEEVLHGHQDGAQPRGLPHEDDRLFGGAGALQAVPGVGDAVHRVDARRAEFGALRAESSPAYEVQPRECGGRVGRWVGGWWRGWELGVQ